MSTPWYALNVSQPFYWTWSDTHAHSGIDLATDPGRPITAPFSGTQVSQGTEPWGGQENMMVKDSFGNYEVLSWLHMSGEVPIGPGSPIHAGDLLGWSGTPPPGFGNGPHIHFERTQGKLPPYMAYNPWYPTATSFPVNPQPVLTELIRGGEGGTLGGSGGGIIGGGLGGGGIGGGPTQGYDLLGANVSGIDPFGIQAAFSGFEKSIGQDLTQAQTQIADALKRAGVIVLGLVLAIVGLAIIFSPVLKEAAQDIGGEAKELAGSAAKAAIFA